MRRRRPRDGAQCESVRVCVSSRAPFLQVLIPGTLLTCLHFRQVCAYLLQNPCECVAMGLYLLLSSDKNTFSHISYGENGNLFYSHSSSIFLGWTICCSDPVSPQEPLMFPHILLDDLRTNNNEPTHSAPTYTAVYSAEFSKSKIISGEAPPWHYLFMYLHYRQNHTEKIAFFICHCVVISIFFR